MLLIVVFVEEKLVRFPLRGDVFLSVTSGWILTPAYVRNLSINQ